MRGGEGSEANEAAPKRLDAMLVEESYREAADAVLGGGGERGVNRGSDLPWIVSDGCDRLESGRHVVTVSRGKWLEVMIVFSLERLCATAYTKNVRFERRGGGQTSAGLRQKLFRRKHYN